MLAYGKLRFTLLQFTGIIEIREANFHVLSKFVGPILILLI